MRDTFNEHDPVLPTFFPGALLRWMLEQGYPQEALIKGTMVDPAKLLESEIRISFQQYRILITNAREVSGSAHLGIHYGKTLQLPRLGLVGYAALSAPTLKEALEIIGKYFRLRSPLLKVSLSNKTINDENFAAIRVEETLDLGDNQQFMLESVLSAVTNILPVLTGQSGLIHQVNLSYARPETWDEVASHFDFPIEFDQAHHEIILPLKQLDRAMPQADPVTLKTVTEACDKQMARIENQEGIVTRVKDLIRFSNHFPSLVEAAAKLAVSPRTLRRELQKIGTSYQRVLDDVRKQNAIDYLSTTTLTVQQIGSMLGYSDTSTFARAFRKWTGRSPTSYRSI